MDPAREYYNIGEELLNCCLARTLLSSGFINGAGGGNGVVPDLATSMPTESSDGRIWTFKIRSGVRYAPPFQKLTVTASDFIRGLLREAESKTAAAYPFYYSDIEGFEDVLKGKATSISGLFSPDSQTLQVTLIKPIGYFPQIWTLPATSPIPPSPGSSNAPLGAATGHNQTYGQFLVSTGPYMFRGADQTDYAKPGAQQQGPAGFQAGKSYVLLRNPSWDPVTDPIRKAYVDEIDMSVGGTVADVQNKVEAGELDVMDQFPNPEGIHLFQTSPALRPFLHSDPVWNLNYFAMNLAMPPFDDIHIRKAVNWVVDKAGLRRLSGGSALSDIATHFIPNSLLPDLASYDPYKTAEASGDLSKSKGEMMLSKYDNNHDGICDAPACKNVLMPIPDLETVQKGAALLQQNLSSVGITLNIRMFQVATAFTKCEDPTSKVGICPLGWNADFGDPYGFVTGLFSSTGLSPACCDISLLGATSQQLRSWGYASATPIPSMDSRLDVCVSTQGIQRQQCYSNIDRYLMEDLVPGVPTGFARGLVITSRRVRNYHLDPAFSWISLSLVALANGGK